jgi:hypothetical protein
MTVDEIIRILETFIPFPDDDQVNDTVKFLYELMDTWKQLPEKNKAIVPIFRLMEKYPHADFGTPGPLVHALESPGTDYKDQLQLSLLRKPTPLTLWMYNRVMNAEKNQAILEGHLARFKLFAKHPLADETTRMAGTSFVEYQQKRLNGRD